MHFATLPPEISSGRMYSGPGSQSMMFAATAWDELAAQLHGMVADYSSVTSDLAQRWQGPTATTMTQAAAHHIEWVAAAAAHAEQAAARARAAANAYEVARAAMVPPAVIEANRARRLSMASSDCLGETGPAIADAEADYDRMWARDIDALYAYACASADASAVLPFTSPPRCRDATATEAPGTWARAAAPDVISTGRQVMAAVSGALEQLSASPLATFDAYLLPVASSLSKLSSLSAPWGFAISHLNSLNKAAALLSLIPKPRAAGGARITAGFGRATSIGRLSVPGTWASVAPGPVAVEPQRGWICEPLRLVDRCGLPPWTSCQ